MFQPIIRLDVPSQSQTFLADQNTAFQHSLVTRYSNMFMISASGVQ